MTVTLLIEIIGAIGLVSYVLSYAMLQLGIIRGNDYTYPIMNLIGATFVAVSLINAWNLWSALISLAFGSFSIIGITRVYLHRRELEFTKAEQGFYDARFRLLSRLDMRRILERGEWFDGEKGDVLTTQSKPVTSLYYIQEGEVEIDVGGEIIAHVGEGEFIGELACLDRGPASATVRLSKPTRYFSISSEALNVLVKSNADLRAQIEFAFAGNIRSKLLATNQKLEQVLRDTRKRKTETLAKAAKRSNSGASD